VCVDIECASLHNTSLVLIDVSVNIRTSVKCNKAYSRPLQFIFKELKIQLFLNEFFYNFVVFLCTW